MKYRSALLICVVAILPLLTRADEYTGMPAGDPKELLPLHAASGPSCGLVGFLPLPNWSHVTTLPPLPDVLKPYGKKTTVTAATPTGPVSPPAPSLAPPKEPTPAPVTTETTTASPPPAPAPASTPDPTLIAVSPFLQWVKSNPQAAMEQARQQADAYRAPATAAPGNSAPNSSSGTTVPQDAYWLPPMLDSDQNASDSQTPGSSAAIYSTPQR